MREILFRGKNDNDEWVYGWLGHLHCRNPYTKQISSIYFTEISNDFKSRLNTLVDYKTVGQFTGLIDKNGKKIFEGDIVKVIDDILGSPFCYGITGKVVYCESAFFVEPKDVMNTEYLFNECAVYEVIGNIHDNPELLENP